VKVREERLAWKLLVEAGATVSKERPRGVAREGTSKMKWKERRGFSDLRFLLLKLYTRSVK